ncbi:C4b-binding protein alpha chain isoform X1 [Heterocephalus glaber]|uniref:C4b-binding protein alpha chain isoform X1 n=1 Tax=Heterocephalus glaber TaxID=10181 RepID=A0AAX6RQF0_HETGA|nr:C4b-binding protein alpha chain isoform X1 [Heterocephalus glaber]XP_021097956.1 C4b-binding protein alpha chain isoform X1 [Heterocephalus glaber]XP_021097957.1 C4b-binding protein alpha chain isoform X1 [Heterocephalus glaber]
MEVALDLNSEREQSRKLSEKHQVLRPPRAPNGTHHRKGALRAWPFSGLCGVSHPALFQITLVASLLATVLGRCGPPPVLLFASPTMELNQTEFETETVLKYTCRPGYTRSSSVQTLTCNISGRWKYNVFCIKKRCRNPGDLPNGIMEIKTDFFLGSQIEFSCLEGYILVGPSTSVCEIQDKAVDWSAPFPVCEIVKCESPPDISNGKHSGEDEDLYTYGSSVTYSCDPNYSLVGNASISCVVVNKTVGVWSPRPPTCEKIICRQPTIPHAKILSGFGPIYTLKDSIMFSCQKGFVLRGSSVIHCEADNTWSPSPPVCEPKVCCAAPEVKHGGSIETKAAFTTDCPYSHKDVIFYRCPGRQMRSATCQLDGTWSAHTPLCSQGCEVPPSIAHGHYEKVSSYFSSYTFVYKCDEGYKLVGQEKLSCKDSQWLPEAPQCKAQCLKPKIADGKLSVNKPLYVESENITIHCNAGFGVVGSRSITCSGNRTWYPEVPRCEWEVLEGCEQVIAGRKLMQCLSNPAEVQMALEVYKLSLEIELLQLQIDKAGQSTRES